jgi:hypothetical protein
VSSAIKVKITGLDELVKRLEGLPEGCRAAVSEAVEAGAKEFQSEIARQAPEGTVNDFKRANAFDIQKSKSKTKISWFIAPSSKLKSTMTRWKAKGAMTLAALAIWCEFGHETTQEGDPGLTKKGRKRSKNYLVSHGFRTAKNPFVTRGYLIARGRAQAAIESRMKRWLAGLTK